VLFLGNLIRRWLTGERLEMLCVDGGSALLAALPTAFPDIPLQRCWVGAQDPQRPEQGTHARPGADQGQPASDYERYDPTWGLVRCPPLR
jgi:hypothetical protein